MSAIPELKITEFKTLPSLAESFKANPELASTTTSILIRDDQEDDDDDNDDDDDEAATSSQESRESTTSQVSQDVVVIIDIVQQRSQLTAFQWSGNGIGYKSRKHLRPEMFWTALSKTATTLRNLNLGFYVHEIHDLRGIAVFPFHFENLESLELDLSGGHGDDASQIDSLLRNIHRLQRLTLSLPTCDLESCRIQGLSWDHSFPNLTNLSLSVYDSPDSDLPDFLEEHTSVLILSLNLDSDERIDFSNTAFPNLHALEVDHTGSPPFHNLLSESTPRPIRHLNVGRWDEFHYTGIARAGPKLTCLEARGVYDGLRGQTFPQQLKETLLHLPHLTELALDLQTGNLSTSNEDGRWGNPRPMDVDDLPKVCECLPAESKVRAVRMVDDRGLPLPEGWLASLPAIPRTLEYVGWETRDRPLLYRLERQEGGTRAVLCEPVRTISNKCVEDWTDQSILNHLD